MADEHNDTVEPAHHDADPSLTDETLLAAEEAAVVAEADAIVAGEERADAEAIADAENVVDDAALAAEVTEESAATDVIVEGVELTEVVEDAPGPLTAAALGLLPEEFVATGSPSPARTRVAVTVGAGVRQRHPMSRMPAPTAASSVSTAGGASRASAPSS